MESAGPSGVSDLEDLEIGDSILSLLLAESQSHYFISSSTEIAALGRNSAYAESPALCVQAAMPSAVLFDSPLPASQISLTQLYAQSSPLYPTPTESTSLWLARESASQSSLDRSISSTGCKSQKQHYFKAVSEAHPFGAPSLTSHPLDIPGKRPQMTQTPENLLNFQGFFQTLAQGTCNVSQQQSLNSGSLNGRVRACSASSVWDFSGSSTPDYPLSALPDRQNSSSSGSFLQLYDVVNNKGASLESFCAEDDVCSAQGAHAFKSMSKTELYMRNDKSVWRKGRYSEKTNFKRKTQCSRKTIESFVNAEKTLGQLIHLSQDPLGQDKPNDDENHEAVVFWVETHDLNPDDGYGWRKYGQKIIKGQIYPRNYLKCDHNTRTGCPVKKKIQRLTQYEDFVEIVYEQRHNHLRVSLDLADTL